MLLEKFIEKKLKATLCESKKTFVPINIKKFSNELAKEIKQRAKEFV